MIGGMARRLFEGFAKIRIAKLEGGSEAERDARCARDRGTEKRYAYIDARVDKAGEGDRAGGNERARSPVGQREPGSRTRKCEYAALGKKLEEYASAARADG